jgi:uracil-DNA glycosylase family 4
MAPPKTQGRLRASRPSCGPSTGSTGKDETSREALERIALDVDDCRRGGGCGYPPCGAHAVGKPSYQLAEISRILVIGEAPAADGWWVTGRAFYQKAPKVGVRLSRTGSNLNDCLAVLGVSIEDVSFVEAVKCRPRDDLPWQPHCRARKQCSRFLREQLLIIRPELVLPLGFAASASCFHIAFGEIGVKRGDVAGKIRKWCSLRELQNPARVSLLFCKQDQGIASAAGPSWTAAMRGCNLCPAP